MGSKTVSISLTEAQDWKLEELESKTGISKSGLMQRALMLLISEYSSYTFPGGSIGKDATEEEIEKEYQSKG